MNVHAQLASLIFKRYRAVVPGAYIDDLFGLDSGIIASGLDAVATGRHVGDGSRAQHDDRAFGLGIKARNAEAVTGPFALRRGVSGTKPGAQDQPGGDQRQGALHDVTGPHRNAFARFEGAATGSNHVHSGRHDEFSSGRGGSGNLAPAARRIGIVLFEGEYDGLACQ